MKELERCGFCGRWFRGEEFMYAEDMKGLSEKEANDAPLGYCPDAPNEDPANNQPPQYITRDMAIDAGDPSMEGQLW